MNTANRTAWDEARAKARIFKALGHPTRLVIVERLVNRPHCVCELVALVPGRPATTSRHLAVLVAAGVLRRRREGVKMMYELAVPCILRALPCAIEALRRDRQSRRKACR